MARHSSDSDSDYSSRYRRKYSRRSRSSSIESSDSSPHRKRSSKHSRSKRRHRSRSRSHGRDRSSRSYKSGRSNSRDREKRRYHSGRDRSHSLDRTKKKIRSISREKSRSRSSSSQSNAKSVLFTKSQNVLKDDFPIEPRFKEDIIDEINSEGFTPKQFTSSQNKESKFKNIVIDISTDTIQTPAVAEISNTPESIFHSSLMIDQDARFDKWVKKLYTLRQKAIVDVQSNVT